MQIQITSSERKHIFVLLFLVPFLMGTGVDLYVPSLPAIASYFHASKHLVQLTIGLYMLGYAIGQMLLGVLSDSLGRKSILVISGFIYVIVSFISVFSSNIDVLIICRFIQGFAIAGPGVVCRAIATDCFSGLALTKAMTYISISWALGPILGPFIGGYLQDYFNWQADFYFFALYGFFTFIYAAMVLKETHVQLTPLHPIEIAKTIKTVITHPLFLMYSVIGALIYAVLVVFNVVAPFLIQTDLHYSAIDYGRFALVLGFGYFIGNFSNRFLVNYVNPVKIILLSLTATVIMSLIMIGMGHFFQPNLYIILTTAALLFCFCGFAFSNIMAVGVGLFPKMAGTSSAIFGSWVAAGVFIMSSLATLLNTHSQTPLAWMYLGMMGACLLLFILCIKIKNNSST